MLLSVFLLKVCISTYFQQRAYQSSVLLEALGPVGVGDAVSELIVMMEADEVLTPRIKPNVGALRLVDFLSDR